MLTVISMTDDTYTVTAMKETLDRSNLGLLEVGDEVNVERSMMMNGRLDGHIVQGHVDQTATCVDIKDARAAITLRSGMPLIRKWRSAVISPWIKAR